MKLFKKLFTATIILLIILSIAGIIYVLQFQEEKPEIKEPEKVTKKVAAPKKIEKTKSLPAKKIPLREVAIIIDDIGYDLDAVKALMKIDANLTFAVLPFQKHSREAAEIFHKAKREVLLHLPMEPVSYPQEKPGEGALFTDMNHDEILFQLKKDIASVPYVAGVNNHMGSKFMMDEQKLSLIFKELKKERLFFIDSRTSPDTKALSIAKKNGVNVAERKIFIDHNNNYNEIYNKLINVSQSNDDSPKIIIGHPHPETIKALKDAVKIMREKGVSIVPVSRVLKKTSNAETKSSLTSNR